MEQKDDEFEKGLTDRIWSRRQQPFINDLQVGDRTVNRPGLRRSFSDLRKLRDDDFTILDFQHRSLLKSICSVVGFATTRKDGSSAETLATPLHMTSSLLIGSFVFSVSKWKGESTRFQLPR